MYVGLKFLGLEILVIRVDAFLEEFLSVMLESEGLVISLSSSSQETNFCYFFFMSAKGSCNYSLAFLILSSRILRVSLSPWKEFFFKLFRLDPRNSRLVVEEAFPREVAE